LNLAIYAVFVIEVGNVPGNDRSWDRDKRLDVGVGGVMGSADGGVFIVCK
jgi:hypothetical protein